MLNLFKQIRPNFLKIKFNNFARFGKQAEASEVEIITNEKVKTKKLKSKIETIEVEETIKIKPYFSQAVSAKEKSFTSVSVSGLIEDPKTSRSDKKEQMKKQKLAQKKGVALENIKRQLPNEL
jgi:hypothetical protein